jgi:hypothetical protein
MNEPTPHIIADGRERLTSAQGYRELKQQIEEEVRRGYADVWVRASVWRRLWLEVKVHREVRTRLGKRFPPSALHVSELAR